MHHHKKHGSNWLQAHGDVSFGVDATAAPHGRLARIGLALKSAWTNWRASHPSAAMKAAQAARSHRRGGDPYALGQSLNANLTDSDGELEALITAEATDPYALKI